MSRWDKHWNTNKKKTLDVYHEDYVITGKSAPESQDEPSEDVLHLWKKSPLKPRLIAQH